MRLLIIVSGVMLVLTGLFCFANPGETFLALAFILGMVMIVSSIIQFISYWWGRANRKDNNGWIFVESIITLILGVLVMTGHIAADAAVPMVFGLWIMFSGVLRIGVATVINPINKKANFISTLIIGLLCAIGGLYGFLNPNLGNLPIAVLLGIMFLLQGISMLELGIHMPHEKKGNNNKPKAKRIKIQLMKPADAVATDDSEGNVAKEEINIDEIKQALESSSEPLEIPESEGPITFEAAAAEWKSAANDDEE